VLKPAVAAPAVALLVNLFNTGLMAADAVGLYDPLLTFSNVNPFRHPAGIKYGNVPKTIEGFPEVIDAPVFMGQVTVDTLDGAMGAHMKPCLEVGLHGVAGGAEERGLCLGHEVRRAETQEQSAGSAHDAQEKDPDKNLPLVLVDSAHFSETSPGYWFSVDTGRYETES
jgi:hypothetical protein